MTSRVPRCEKSRCVREVLWELVCTETRPDKLNVPLCTSLGLELCCVTLRNRMLCWLRTRFGSIHLDNEGTILSFTMTAGIVLTDVP